MNMPYTHELKGIWYLLSNVFTYPFEHWTKWALIASIPLAIIALYFMAFYTLYFFKYFLTGNANGHFVRSIFFYKNRNAFLSLDRLKHPVKMFYRVKLPTGSGRKCNWYNVASEHPRMIATLTVYFLFSWLFWYVIQSLGWPSIITSLLPIKVIFVYALVAISIFLYFYGHLSLMLMLIVASVLNAAYFYGIDIGFPVIDANYILPHWTVNFFTTWAFGWHQPLVINPNGYDIDINKYVYVIFLLFTYYSLLRYVLNFFYWKFTKKPPSKLFDQYFTEEEIKAREQKRQEEMDKTPYGGLIKNINPDIDLGDDSKPKTFAHEREMKLLGFTDKTIAALRGQYSDAQIARALDAVMDQAGSSPKTSFINYLEESDNAN